MHGWCDTAKKRNRKGNRTASSGDSPVDYFSDASDLDEFLTRSAVICAMFLESV